MGKKAVLLILALMVLALPAAVGAMTGDQTTRKPASPTGAVCDDGMAGIYPCQNVNLLAHLPLDQIGAEDETVKGNDHWGWTDPQSGRDFVVFGLSNGTSFVEITDRANPAYLGKLPSHDGVSTWRDIKVFADHAFIVADIPTEHGLQIFDLSQLLTVVNPPVTFTETVHYDGFGAGHNLWINETTGFLYAFRTDGDGCNAGIHMVNVQDPLHPTFAGCVDADEAPLSDAECVIYAGPDVAYTGRELCFVGSDDNVSIADVTDKGSPLIVASFVYDGIERAHQGALTPDQRYWLLSDTMDEPTNGHNTRTYVFDVADVDAPVVLGYYEHNTTARDHNVYIVDHVAYQSNWKSGLRLLDIGHLPSTAFNLLGYFDIAPGSDSVDASGAWNNYPWWADGVVTVSGTDEGLFVLKPLLNRRFFPTTPIR